MNCNYLFANLIRAVKFSLYGTMKVETLLHEHTAHPTLSVFFPPCGLLVAYQEIKRQTQGVVWHSHCRIQSIKCDRPHSKVTAAAKIPEIKRNKTKIAQVSRLAGSSKLETAKKGRAKSSKWDYVPEVVGAERLAKQKFNKSCFPCLYKVNKRV